MESAEPLEFICQLGGEFDVIQNGIVSRTGFIT